MSADRCKHGIRYGDGCRDCEDDDQYGAEHSFAAPLCSALHGATYKELDDANAALCAENARLKIALDELIASADYVCHRLNPEMLGMRDLMDAVEHARRLSSPNAELTHGPTP